ncbi:mRNA (2'-O-methyladenosine-N(6)-)-methyltransferase (Cap-specific adenosine methyltransferase) (CAPAM) (hCAPAM) (Phosphorylated CTD-interacting factor 1) (hPCIF1) (Protein phosphatase 1 regulatory subunit 121) [Durusdinium trenchii]
MRRATKRAEQLANSGASWAAKFRAFMQKETSFWDITFCLLCRYDAMCGPGHKEGGGFHAAIPAATFDALDSMGDIGDVFMKSVKVECFASPQLCNGVRGAWNYCSAFKDLDVLFGSLGPFLDEEMDIGKLGGTYEVNPPFVRGVVLRLASKLLNALEMAQSEGRSLCIFLVLPGLAQHKLMEGKQSLPQDSDALDQLLGCQFRRAFSASTRRAFTNGLAFKTEKAWPLFAVPTTLALFDSNAKAEVAESFQCLCESWGHEEPVEKSQWLRGMISFDFIVFASLNAKTFLQLSCGLSA